MGVFLMSFLFPALFPVLFVLDCVFHSEGFLRKLERSSIHFKN